MPVLADSVVELWDQLVIDSGISVTYRRGAASTALTVVPGTRSTTIEDSEGLITTAKDADFILKSDELIISASRTLPNRGDTLEYTDETGINRKFEVVHPGGERHWDPVDQYGILLRVHAKEVKAA